MLKFIETMVVFQEVPDEITLDINITNCPYRCPGCHSAYLQQDIGQELTDQVLRDLISRNPGISCVLFSGGDSDHRRVLELCRLVRDEFPHLKTAMYSGASKADPLLWDSGLLDYYKIGPWIASKGPLNSPTTNQRLYRRTDSGYEDITYRFWKHSSLIS